MTGGETIESLELHDYEISMSEPLHDLRNLIMAILEEVPAQLEAPLSQLVKQTIDQSIGESAMHKLVRFVLCL